MKIKVPIAALLCAAAFILGASATAPAKEKKTAGPTPEASASPIATCRAIPYHGQVTSVGLSTQTFMVGKRTFKMTDQTQITREARPRVWPMSRRVKK